MEAADNPARRPRSAILSLLSICDSSTGISLYERRWRWHETARPEGVKNLVKALQSFAQGIDDGRISCVNFEQPRQTDSAATRRRGTNQSIERLQMLCHRDESLEVTLFYEISTPPNGFNAAGLDESCTLEAEKLTEQAHELIRQVRQTFSDEYGDKIAAIQSRLVHQSESPDLDKDSASLALQANDFAGFDQKLGQLCEGLFG
uniref:Uncharacterized protein n=1 Tax=Octactis speculum TaxID=3111310 RepID=A0A7S2AXU9_9STRA|mmetsp:Transcript_17097/g.22992  ORF Transcript_17097/g.22992 Transcript_17097/m.22992 type:complete len:204 (+) Transcript_17097:125-736(+)